MGDTALIKRGYLAALTAKMFKLMDKDVNVSCSMITSETVYLFLELQVCCMLIQVFN